ncbi:MAG: FAD-binding protein [Spirochaetes bacterium]|nr:FAD-binding protein [Spirochaetota bacterium]
MTDTILKKLQSIFGSEETFTDRETLTAYSYDAAHTEMLPEVIVFAKNEAQISALMKLANEERIPVTPRGAGSGLSGGSVPLSKGIVVCLDKMKAIKSIDTVNRLITLEAGVITSDIDAAVNPKGLFFPPDPGSTLFSTIGGNVAENAGGLRGLKYGVTKDYVKTIRVVLPSGEAVTLGAKTVKHVAGFNVEQLFVGSEGLLGIFTEFTLSLLPLPEHRESALAVYASLDDAAKTVAAIIEAGVTPSTLEIMDRFTINAIEDYKPCGLPRDAEAVLIIETDGYRESAIREMEKVQTVAAKHAVTRFVRAKDAAEREMLFEGRRVSLSALARVKPTTILEDATVMRSRVPDLVRAIQSIAKKYDLMVGTFGHAGDGNLHPTFLVDKNDKDMMHRCEMAVKELFAATIAMEGTISGEHGIGIEKKPFLKDQLGDAGVKLLRDIKKTLDPNGILNPGKMF